jgi:hypothetical protein
MSDLFGSPLPLRLVLHLNVDRGAGRFSWDGLSQNGETGDLYALTASPFRLRRELADQLAEMHLWIVDQVHQNETAPPTEVGGAVPLSEDRVPPSS